MRSVRIVTTTRADGDLAGDPRPEPALAGAPRPWTWLRQVHGDRVVVVSRPGEHAGVEADAAVTATPGCTLAVRTADCAPVVLRGAHAVAVAHLGWRGVLAGLVARTADAMRELGAAPVAADLGPCIRSGCYEFDGPELDDLAARFGDGVRATTDGGRPALDLAAAVRVALAEQGVTDVRDGGVCTACDERWFSHRVRQDTGRLATLAWIER
ncbi:MAG: polyphenol oxidase family protein [Acidimicrobiales bacterium]|nr:polyphenol oxidase family protein [Acidimicrobiales bacterium]